MLTYRQIASVLGLCLAGGHALAATPAAADPSTDTQQAEATLWVRGFHVQGVDAHPEAGLSADSIQAVADATLARIAGGRLPARLTFAQLEQVAAAVTATYRDAGFLVAQTILPPQQIGDDQIVTLQVVEGRVGKVTVQGGTRYSPTRLAAAAQGLAGHSLRSQDLETALLYTRDLPGVSVIPMLNPGEHPGETDVVLVARDTSGPLQVSLGVNNHGTDSTGRGRAQLGLRWNNPLGLGDVLAASYTYAFDPHQSAMGALSYAVPVTATGLSATAGYSRSQLDVRNGPFAALGLNGPTTQQYLGADWKLANRDDLQVQLSARYIDENSRLSALGFTLSNQKFEAAELGLTLRHVDRPSRSIDLLQASVRQALDDDSAQLDLVSAGHDRHFTVARLGYTRLQGLGTTQRLLLRLNGQYSDDVLVPMEQFSLGGPDTLRAFEQSAVLGDRGYAGTLEYQIDAPGFADKVSPFAGQRWGDLLSFGLFLDQGRVYSNSHTPLPSALQGAGIAMSFRQPRLHDLQLQLSAATPTSRIQPADGHDVRLYASVSMTF